MFWLHILKEDAKQWHPFTRESIIKRYMADKSKQPKCHLVKEGPVVLPAWILEVRYLERGPREWFEVRRGFWWAKRFLLNVARRLERSDFWDAGWWVRRVSFLCERRVDNVAK